VLKVKVNHVIEEKQYEAHGAVLCTYLVMQEFLTIRPLGWTQV
jgi:hypothetical protein